MKVVHVLQELHRSGAEVMLAVSAPRWRELGVTGTVVATGATAGPYAPTLEEAGWDVRHVPFSPRPSHLRQLRRTFSELAPDLVHLHTERASFPYAVVARSLSLPIVRTIHNAFGFEGPLRFERRAQRFLQRRLGVHQVACSHEARRNEARRFGNPTVTVPNWIDVERFRPPTPEDRVTARRRWELSDADVALVSVANCGPAKNHEAILTALPWLPTSIRYLHAGLDRVGEEALVRELDVTDRVRYLGSVEDVVSLLWAADVYAMPSYFEGGPLSALEALAVGVPCVFSDRGGLVDLRRVATPGGAVWGPPTPETVRAAVDGFLAGEWGRVDRQEQHRQVVAEHGMERGVERYWEVYEAALSGRSANMNSTAG